jgi:protease II
MIRDADRHRWGDPQASWTRQGCATYNPTAATWFSKEPLIYRHCGLSDAGVAFLASRRRISRFDRSI